MLYKIIRKNENLLSYMASMYDHESLVEILVALKMSNRPEWNFVLYININY